MNGLRACARKGFEGWLARCRGEIVGLQEVRALPEELPEGLRDPRRWHVHYTPAERRGYSVGGLFSRRKRDALHTSLGEERFDAEGRLQIARFGRLAVANVYFPKGSGRDRDNSRVPYKLDFYRTLFERLQAMRRSGLRVLVMGDFNTAHAEIDLARPRQNADNSGFLPEEREELSRWLRAGYVDSFRHYQAAPGHYSWWSQRSGARQRNIGWRIDYVMVSKAALPFLRGAFIHPKATGSDHVPVGVDMDPAIFD